MYVYDGSITADEFIRKEAILWSEEYIEDLIDKGYSPKLIVNEDGTSKWTWVMPTNSLVISN